MREKLKAYIQNQFRNAPKTAKNQELEEEILQNSLDRFDDLIAQGLSDEAAYTQAVTSIGDLSHLMDRSSYRPPEPPAKKKRRVGLWITIAIVCLLCLLALLFIGHAFMNVFVYSVDYGHGFGSHTDRGDDHWSEQMMDDMEGWVDEMDAEFGFSVLLPGSTYSFPNSERFHSGDAEVQASDISRITIDWIAGSVEVRTWGENEISIQETGATDETNAVHWLAENGELSIQYCSSGIHTSLPSKDLIVLIPETMVDSLRSLNIAGTSQDMTIEDLKLKQAGFFSTSGELNFRGVCENMNLETVSGDTRIRFDSAPDHVSAESVSGDLTLQLPEDRSFELELETVSGDLNTDFPTIREDDDTWRYTVERPIALVTELGIETVSGDVTIEKG